jgi:hypothetical protein
VTVFCVVCGVEADNVEQAIAPQTLSILGDEDQHLRDEATKPTKQQGVSTGDRGGGCCYALISLFVLEIWLDLPAD